jgi:hypothetical protein
MLSHLRRTALAGAAAVVLISATSASANTFCVGVPSCAGTPELSLQAAIDQASTLTGGSNRIELGSGTWIAATKAGAQPQGLEIVGAGTGLTFIRSNVDGEPALWLTGGSESVSGLTVRIVPQLGVMPRGLLLQNGARADGIRVTADAGAGGAAVRMDSGGQLSHAFVDAGAAAIGVLTTDDINPGDAAISDSEIRGGAAIVSTSPATTAVTRDRLAVTKDDRPGVLALEGSMIVRDTLVDLHDVASGVAFLASPANVANATIDARRVTVLASGGQSTGAAVSSGVATGTASISLADSVLRDVGIRVLRSTAGAASVALDHVDTWPAAGDQTNGLAVTDVASSSADPLLGADLVPQPGSPLIDRATALTAADGTTDLEGTPRSLDGDGDCSAQPDIGAFEAAAMACSVPAPSATPAPAAKDTTAPIIARLRFAHRHRHVVAVRFLLSETAAVTVRVSRCTTKTCAQTAKAIVIRRRSATGAITLRLAHRLRHGRYTIRVTAVDGAGNRAIKTARRLTA